MSGHFLYCPHVTRPLRAFWISRMRSFDQFASWLLWAQGEGGGGEGGGAGAGGGGGIMSIVMSPMFPFVLIFVLFMFLILPNERKRKAEQKKLLEGVKKNDRVLTIGGVLGTVVNVQKGDEYIVLRVDENSNTRITVLRSAIARVVVEDANGKKEKAAD